jgi:hypothetical protein
VKKALLALAAALFSPLAAPAQDAPTLRDVTVAPATYAGRTLTFPKLKLSGTITKFDFGGVRKYYLTVETAGKRVDAGFFLAPPDVADKLGDYVSPRSNYEVNLSCKIERITINGFPQWHGIVTKVEFLTDGKVSKTIQQAKK